MARQIGINQIGEYAKDQLKKLVQAAVSEADKRLRSASPVDTGRFRSNWQTQQQGLSGSVSNNLPYAERLANGYSSQAPSGWVDAIAKDIQTYVNAEAGRIGR